MSTQLICKTIADYFKNQPIQRAWLFGSFARGEEMLSSDVDILFQYDIGARVNLLVQAIMICDLEKLLDWYVDVVTEEKLQPRVAERVNRDKKLIYERDCSRQRTP